MAPELHRLLLGLFFLAADIGDDVVKHFRPRIERLASAGNGLIRADQRLFDAVLHERMQRGHVALQRAVGLDGDEAALGAEALALGVDDADVVRIDLGHDHRDVRGVAVSRIIGDDRAFELGIALLERLDLVFFHIDGAEHEVDLLCDLLCVGLCIHHDHGADALRNRIRHVPFFADRFGVGLACAVCAGCKNDGREPGVIRRQQDEPLADHTRSADDTDSEFFHDESSNLQTRRKVPVACHFGM